VEFAVVRASLASQLGNILVSALAIWLPLLPLWFFARRIIDARSGSGSKKLKRPVDMPRVTFADVAGEEGGGRWQQQLGSAAAAACVHHGPPDAPGSNICVSTSGWMASAVRRM
jgi:hypothetical protein